MLNDFENELDGKRMELYEKTKDFGAQALIQNSRIGMMVICLNAALPFCVFRIVGPAIHRQVLCKENFMQEHYKDRYLEYRKKIRSSL